MDLYQDLQRGELRMHRSFGLYVDGRPASPAPAPRHARTIKPRLKAIRELMAAARDEREALVFAYAGPEGWLVW